jgi:chromosome segregation ATPase
LSHVLDRRTERAERRKLHITELRKRAAEADAKLKRLYDAIENGVADLSDPMLKDRIGELKATRDQARVDAERAEDAIERGGPTIGPVAELVGIESGVVSGVFNLESSGVSASDWRPRHDEHYHEA